VLRIDSFRRERKQKRKHRRLRNTKRNGRGQERKGCKQKRL
jgi:hypothetical protein